MRNFYTSLKVEKKYSNELFSFGGIKVMKSEDCDESVVDEREEVFNFIYEEHNLCGKSVSYDTCKDDIPHNCFTPTRIVVFQMK